METETLAVDEIKPLPVPESRWERVLYALIVIVLPVVCFFLSDELKPAWQSGELSDYVALLLIPQVAWFFFPFLIYSVVCMLLLLVAPARFAARFAVRFGIYTGVVLALQYVILVVGTGFALMSAISASILILCKLIFGKTKSEKLAIGVLLFLVSAGLIIAIGTNSIVQLPFLVCVAVLIAAPYLCLAVAGVTAFKLIRHYETKISLLLWQGTGVIAWLAAYIVAWRFSVLQAIEVYHSLPASPPDCYIATASARGHRRVVRSWLAVTSHGNMLVTRQLQVFKCAELALMTFAPHFHVLLRWVYDRFGPPLAHGLANPFLADLAYLTLKPFEWTAVLVLKAIVPEIDEYASALYAQK